MSSDTPRTDAQPPVYEGFPVSREFARALERELNTMREDAARYRWLRDESPNQYEHPLVVAQEKTVHGMVYTGPVSGAALDFAVDAARRKPKSDATGG